MKRNITATRKGQGESCRAILQRLGTQGELCLRLLRFQYKYPGTPMSTIAVPQNAYVGRVMIVFSVHVVPIST